MYNLMIVDDDEILLEGLGTAFDWAALNVRVTATATDGLSALAEMRRQPCDILITDIKMGRMDGLELTRQVREEFPAARVVIMSAYEEFAYAQQAVRMSVDDYLLKPIDLDQLSEIIRKIVESLDSERAHSEKVEGMHRNLIDLGDHTVDEYFRASGLLNTGLVEHLSKAVALGNDRGAMEDIQLLRAHLREVSGGSFIFLMTTISILITRLMESNVLSDAGINWMDISLLSRSGINFDD
ncbi:MAG: response regulator, partial [Clostridia bacterium]|nr:response regulator [Clostridia bacterium]